MSPVIISVIFAMSEEFTSWFQRCIEKYPEVRYSLARDLLFRIPSIYALLDRTAEPLRLNVEKGTLHE